ncbi:hypothetical protein HQ489_00210 [Candidatus Woesearchaeota archaeon]|nr:hypothetical protein [Candidatus Woesearchaeota archaeon]
MLCSIDLLPTPQGYKIVEINGISSGMKGFCEVYGDNRVQEKIFSMLRERYGTLSMNLGYSSWLELEEKRAEYALDHPFKHRLENLFSIMSHKTGITKKLHHYSYSKQPYVNSDKALNSWEFQNAPKNEPIELPFEHYIWQDSYIMNYVNSREKHPNVNPFFLEEILNNKFLTYRLLKDSTIKDYLIPSALTGLGFSYGKDINSVLENGEQDFVIKPIRGIQGIGVEFVKRERVEYERSLEGSMASLKYSLFDLVKENLLKQIIDFDKEIPYVEDMVDKGDLRFGNSLAIIQPFLDTRTNIDGEDYFQSIRAIVCNGEFVDAYTRYSKNPCVNLSQDAKARLFEGDIAQICEDVVETLCESLTEQIRKEIENSNFKDTDLQLWKEYVEERGRTSREERVSRVMRDGINEFIKMLYFQK